MALIENTKQNIVETKTEVFSQTLTLVNSAFAFVAALAWNEAIKGLIETYFKSGTGVYSRFVYAILVTLLLVVVTNRLNKFAGRFKIEVKTTEKK